jgi:hypothetical protein
MSANKKAAELTFRDPEARARWKKLMRSLEIRLDEIQLCNQQVQTYSGQLDIHFHLNGVRELLGLPTREG